MARSCGAQLWHTACAGRTHARGARAAGGGALLQGHRPRTSRPLQARAVRRAPCAERSASPLRAPAPASHHTQAHLKLGALSAVKFETKEKGGRQLYFVRFVDANDAPGACGRVRARRGARACEPLSRRLARAPPRPRPTPRPLPCASPDLPAARGRGRRVRRVRGQVLGGPQGALWRERAALSPCKGGPRAGGAGQPTGGVDARGQPRSRQPPPPRPAGHTAIRPHATVVGISQRAGAMLIAGSVGRYVAAGGGCTGLPVWRTGRAGVGHGCSRPPAHDSGPADRAKRCPSHRPPGPGVGAVSGSAAADSELH